MRPEQETSTDQVAESYRELVRRLARGDHPEFSEVCEVLDAAGKTATQLAQDIATYRREENP